MGNVPTFDDMLAQLLEEPEEVLGVLADVVSRGRMQADDLPPEILEVLAKYDLVAFLVAWAVAGLLGVERLGALRDGEGAAPHRPALRAVSRDLVRRRDVSPHPARAGW